MDIPEERASLWQRQTMGKPNVCRTPTTVTASQVSWYLRQRISLCFEDTLFFTHFATNVDHNRQMIFASPTVVCIEKIVLVI